MGYKIGLCDKDIGYTRGVMEYINKQIDSPVRVAAFSSEDALEEYLKDNSLDLIVLGEEKNIIEANVPIVRISEKKGRHKSIFKYQNGEEILGQILEILKEKELQKQMTSFFYAVYSPVGRCGKTNFSLGLCNLFKDSLYINFEAYSGIDKKELSYIAEAGDKFIYYLVSQNNHILELLDSIPMSKSGFKVVSGNTALDVVTQITKEDIRWFYRLLKENGSYKCIIFDMGCCGLADMGILGEFQKVYIPILEDKTSKIKLESFNNIMEQEGCCNLQYIKVPDATYDNQVMTQFIQSLLEE